MKPAAFPVLRATRLLDQVRERIRYKHYSLRTEQTYVQWVRLFIKWHGLRHPRDMAQPEIEAFLGMLANERQVAASTHNQALSALLFLYREVLSSASNSRIAPLTFSRAMNRSPGCGYVETAGRKTLGRKNIARPADFLLARRQGAGAAVSHVLAMPSRA